MKYRGSTIPELTWLADSANEVYEQAAKKLIELGCDIDDLGFVYQDGIRHLLHMPTLFGYKFQLKTKEKDASFEVAIVASPVKLKRLVFAPTEDDWI